MERKPKSRVYGFGFRYVPGTKVRVGDLKGDVYGFSEGPFRSIL